MVQNLIKSSCLIAWSEYYKCGRSIIFCFSRFGDRILSVEGRDFRSVTRKEAAELLRSCDELSITMEISRSVSRLKPRPLVSEAGIGSPSLRPSVSWRH